MWPHAMNNLKYNKHEINVRGRADKFCLQLNRKWTVKEILMKKIYMPASITFKVA